MDQVDFNEVRICKKVNVFIQLTNKEPILSSVNIGDDIEQQRGIYFGMGLSGRTRPSKELPFSIFNLLLSGEILKRGLDLERGTILIADEHSKTNWLEDDISKLAEERSEFLQRTLEKLSFLAWRIVLGSQLIREPDYQQVLESASAENINKYGKTSNN